MPDLQTRHEDQVRELVLQMWTCAIRLDARHANRHQTPLGSLHQMGSERNEVAMPKQTFKCPTCRTEAQITDFSEYDGFYGYCPGTKCGNLVKPIPVKKSPRRPNKDGSPKRPALTRQRRERLSKDATYLVLRDLYLESNPFCVRCGKKSTQVHHVCRGQFRAQSLLNTDTWLGVCGSECHDAVEKLPIEKQVALKQRTVRLTIERLRK